MVTLSNDHDAGNLGGTALTYDPAATPHGMLSRALAAAPPTWPGQVVTSADMYFVTPPQWEHYDHRSCDQGPAVDLRCWQHVQLRCGHGQPVRPRMTGEPFWVDGPPPASDPGWILGPDDSA